MDNQQHIGKLLPVDGFCISFYGEISTSYFQSLTHLYQPLIGAHAVSLYQTLLSEFQLKKHSEIPQTHHMLMNYLSLPLDVIYKARLKLEAIGLLESYIQEIDHQQTFLYKLKRPFTPAEFFEDGMLSQLLYHHLGDDKFNQVFNLFHTKVPGKITGENVTANFNDVFETHTNSAPIQTNQNKNEDVNKGPNLNGTIDYNWLEQMLTQRMLPSKRILTAANLKLMEQMIALYNLTDQDIEKAVLWAVSDENDLNKTEFKTACLDLFQSRQQKSTVKLVDRRSDYSDQKENTEKPLSKQDQFIKMLEQISPRQLLEDLGGGNSASTQDLKVVSDVMSQQGLNPGVMNVLIHYVLLKTNMKLTKSYLEKIASHWARKNVTTVRQAMALAKSENNKYQEWGTNTNKKQSYYKKPTKKEVIPDWFSERKKQEGSQKSSVKNTNKESKEDIEALLNNLNNI
ncbi:replication initiation and membrane attachment family protein [Aquibacillus kalidii]|uniref:replication initiation and membrane attachment family protein n=1 Tax=Aquibacillus kalidii TaxID=2762597 RepID=UPI0016494EA5|nr:DnaD domain protein [Aquibacillus kalidii]